MAHQAPRIGRLARHGKGVDPHPDVISARRRRIFRTSCRRAPPAQCRRRLWRKPRRQQRPGWWMARGQARCQPFRNPPRHKRTRRRRRQRPAPPAWAIDDRDGHQVGDLPPAAPAVELGQIVGPHHPHEAHPSIPAAQKADHVDAVGRPQPGLERGDDHASARGKALRGLGPCTKIPKFIMLFQWVARRHKPPHAIQPKPLEGCLRHRCMALVRGIEAAAHEADTLTGEGRRRPRAGTMADGAERQGHSGDRVGGFTDTLSGQRGIRGRKSQPGARATSNADRRKPQRRVLSDAAPAPIKGAGWRRTGSSPTGSGPEGSSPNDQKPGRSPAS